MKTRLKQNAFTLAEMMVAMAISGFIVAATLTASTSLQKMYAASDGYSRAEGDQMRISDYIALDVRRAVTAAAANTTSVTVNGVTTTTPGVSITTTIKGSSSTTTVTVPSVLTLTIPDYYASSGSPNNPSLSSGAITYGTTNPTIRYFQISTAFYREYNGTATAIANNVGNFNVTQQDLTANVKCTITFTPTYNFTASTAAVTGSSTFSTTFLRNAIARN